jgi:hypothetical protein
MYGCSRWTYPGAGSCSQSLHSLYAGGPLVWSAYRYWTAERAVRQQHQENLIADERIWRKLSQGKEPNLLAMDNLADLLMNQKRWKEAEPFCRKLGREITGIRL